MSQMDAHVVVPITPDTKIRQENNAEVIELLESALAEAKAGQIDSVFITSVTNLGWFGGSFATGLYSGVHLLGAVEAIKTHMARDLK